MDPTCFLSLLNSLKFSDYTIHCKGEDFHVHKAILSTASSYFRAVCSERQEKGRTFNSKDVEKNEDLMKDDPWILANMLERIYTGSYGRPLDWQIQYKAKMETRRQKNEKMAD